LYQEVFISFDNLDGYFLAQVNDREVGEEKE